MPTTFTPIISYTLTNSTQQYLDLTGIPQNYTDLYVVVTGTGVTGGGSVWCQCNGDAGSNYTYSFMWNNAGSTSTGNAVGTSGQVGRITQVPSGTDGGGYAIFLNYANSSYYKYWVNRTSRYDIALNGISAWRNTAAITRLRLGIESGSLFNTGFRIDVYGILKA
jgi:hypothetical protein